MKLLSSLSLFMASAGIGLEFNYESGLVCDLTQEQKGIVCRSNPENYSLSNGITFKTDFLAQARHMAAPEITEIDFVLEGAVGGAAGGALGRDAAKCIDTFKMFDGEDFVNVSGAGQRCWEMMELGNRRFDPASVASDASNTSYRYRWRFPFCSFDKATRGYDFSIPLTNLLEGGQITIQTPAALPTGWTSGSLATGKVTVYAYVRDARVREAKSRRRLREEQWTQIEYDYQVNGFLRAAILTSKLTTTGYTDLTSFTAFNSRTLRWPASYALHDLIDSYLYNSNGIDYSGLTAGQSTLAMNDEFLRTTTAAIALVCPDRSQMTGQMLDTKTMHLDTLIAAATGGRILTDVVTDRLPDSTALWLGQDSPGAAQNAVKNMGMVNGGDGREYKVGGFNAALARKLPIRIG